MSKIALTPNASGTGVFTISSPATNTNRTLTLPDITGTLVSTDASGNVGIGVVPESSYPDRPVVRVGSGLGLMCRKTGNPSHTWINTNAYQDPSTADDKYIDTDEASQIKQINGAFSFNVAASGAADSFITWNTAMTITQDGNVLVGKTSGTTDSYLQIAGSGSKTSLRLENNYASGSVCLINNQGNSTFNAFIFENGGSAKGSIVVTTSATSYNTSSDYRLKTDAQPMTGASDRVLALKPVNFEWISSGTRVDGFLAHEAQAVVPECVTGTKDAVDEDGNAIMQGIDQSKLVPLLTAALQEALNKIDAMETRLAALEAV
jgi:hypothetical protein